jgi:hypothetical protein
MKHLTLTIKDGNVYWRTNGLTMSPMNNDHKEALASCLLADVFNKKPNEVLSIIQNAQKLDTQN